MWKWVYEVNDAGDANDTALGIAGTDTITVDFTLSATQVLPSPNGATA